MRERRFRLLPHTADVMVEVRGEDPPALFESGVLALFSLLVDRRSVRGREVRIVEARGDSAEERFLALLRAAFLLFAAHAFLVRTAHVTMKGNRVTLTATGEPLDPARHRIVREIKAVTAHAAVVGRSRGTWFARFVLDV